MSKKVVIVGAGAAGISTAVKLAESGIKVTLFEASSQIGGRMSSIVDRTTGEFIDVGQHLMVGAYSDFFALLKKFDSFRYLSKQKQFKIEYKFKDGFSTRIFSKIKGKTGFISGLMNLGRVGFSSKMSLLSLLKSLERGNVNAEMMSCAEFLKNYKQGHDIIKVFWEPLILATLNVGIKTAPASLLVEVLRQAFLAGEKAASIYIPSVGLSELLNPAVEYLKRFDGNIIIGKRVKSVNYKNDVSPLKLASSVVSDGDIVTAADAVIFAIPPESLHRIFMNDNFSNIKLNTADLPTSPIITVYLWFDKQVMDIDFFAAIDTKVQWVFNKRMITSENPYTKSGLTGGHLALVISAADEFADMRNDELTMICIEELKHLLPKVKDAKLLHSRVINYRKATVKFDVNNERLRPSARTNVPNIFLAGDWTATKLPATIESAVRSGIRAADSVIEYFHSDSR